MKLSFLDVVVLTRSLTGQYLQKGAIGTIVEMLPKNVFLVEFADKRGVTYAIVDLPASLLMKVVREPLAEAA